MRRSVWERTSLPWSLLLLSTGLVLGCFAERREEVIFLPRSEREELLRQGEEVAELIRQQDVDALYARFSREMQRLNSRDSLRRTIGNYLESAPLGARISGSAFVVRAHEEVQRVYVAGYEWTGAQEMGLMVAFSEEDRSQILSMSLTPPKELPADPYAGRRPQTRLRLPVRAGETWGVFYGGPARWQGYESPSLAQRHALELVAVDEQGRTHTGEGTENSQYYCWERPVLAPADATVVEVAQGTGDNLPRDTVNGRQPLGNYVLLDFGNGEYGLFGYLRNGSLQVQPGQRVSTGQVLGLCGNSGISSEPRVHVHLQDGPATTNGAQGLPLLFVDYALDDGTPVPEGLPVRGELIHTPAP
jgi:hypothetical protein